MQTKLSGACMSCVVRVGEPVLATSGIEPTLDSINDVQMKNMQQEAEKSLRNIA
ncbi:hypothetical protein [Novosphingobium guangzhouense]|uniref:hypothetical protein n=1 Tax=Novosphingobium guangzhouense TaxID=1850347 RepID=UPI001474D444|nr:hypothetical protein [Novosphingobium guangzhouense]